MKLLPKRTSYRPLYPPIEPYATHRISVSPVHSLYVEESGNPMGNPVVFLHGGPGAGSFPWMRQCFDPQHYRIVLYDQRGCGKSTPYAEIQENTTWHLVDDLEKIRTHLGIEQWLVMGTSWGSLLAVAYAETYPQSVLGLFIRGIFGGRHREIAWVFEHGGASQIYPDAWAAYEQLVPPTERNNCMQAYFRQLTSSDERVRLQAASALVRWETVCARLDYEATWVDPRVVLPGVYALALLEMHYCLNLAFLPTEDHLVKNIQRIRQIPTIIGHGRYDMVCPLENAYWLHQAWPEAELEVIPDAGHTIREPSATHHTVETTDRFRNLPFIFD